MFLNIESIKNSNVTYSVNNTKYTQSINEFQTKYERANINDVVVNADGLVIYNYSDSLVITGYNGKKI